MTYHTTAVGTLGWEADDVGTANLPVHKDFADSPGRTFGCWVHTGERRRLVGVVRTDQVADLQVDTRSEATVVRPSDAASCLVDHTGQEDLAADLDLRRS